MSKLRDTIVIGSAVAFLGGAYPSHGAEPAVSPRRVRVANTTAAQAAPVPTESAEHPPRVRVEPIGAARGETGLGLAPVPPPAPDGALVARTRDESDSAPGTPAPDADFGGENNVFGTLDPIDRWIPLGAFVPDDPAAMLTNGNNDHYPYANMTTGWEAAIDLPNGVKLDTVSVFLRDTDASFNAVAQLFRLEGETDATYLETPITGAVSTSGTPGYTKLVLAPLITIDNRSPGAEASTYYVHVFLTGSTGLGFRGARATYHLQVSPAPAIATFSDVPTGDVYYPYIEAFTAAGITSGCAAGPPRQFCPTKAATRAEVALFISRALGLHFGL